MCDSDLYGNAVSHLLMVSLPWLELIMGLDSL